MCFVQRRRKFVQNDGVFTASCQYLNYYRRYQKSGPELSSFVDSDFDPYCRNLCKIGIVASTNPLLRRHAWNKEASTLLNISNISCHLQYFISFLLCTYLGNQPWKLSFHKQYFHWFDTCIQCLSPEVARKGMNKFYPALLTPDVYINATNVSHGHT